MTYLDNWHDDTLATNSSKVRYSGCWGFERNNEEYAIIGSTEGTHFFHVKNNKLTIDSKTVFLIKSQSKNWDFILLKIYI